MTIGENETPQARSCEGSRRMNTNFLSKKSPGEIEVEKEDPEDGRDAQGIGTGEITPEGAEETTTEESSDDEEKSPSEYYDDQAAKFYRNYDFENASFDVLERFVPQELIGQGAYGVVCSAMDRKSRHLVAMKKIEIVPNHRTYLKRTLREIIFLRSFQHENILSLQSIMRPAKYKFESVYLLSELMETDLSCIIRSPQPLTDEHCQFFIFQILKGLKYVHSANVIHRDIKPRNLLVNSNCDVKICDFGLARLDIRSLESDSANMTDYVATRWYRAPEVMLSWKKYTKGLDMWSVGCILTELLGRRPMFPGKDVYHQVDLIVSVLGNPTPSQIAKVQFPEMREFLGTLPIQGKVPFCELFPEANPKACDLLEHLLCYDPDTRYTVEEALKHPYLEELHVEADEPICKELDACDFTFENENLSAEELFNLIRREIALFHPDDAMCCEPSSKPQKAISRIAQFLRTSLKKKFNFKRTKKVRRFNSY